MLKAGISIDIDTLSTHFRGAGLRSGAYDFSDFRTGILNFLKFLGEFKIKATFFLVGRDLLNEQNIEVAKEILRQGHEIANHSMNHIQGFRHLDKISKENEISAGAKIIFEKLGVKAAGFRAPGWNIDPESLEILKDQRYIYDSSVFPSFLNPVLKFMHYSAMNRRPAGDRTTLGKIGYMFSNPLPHLLSNGLVELPISTTPVFRIPFFATFLLKTKISIFNKSLDMMKYFQRPIIYEFHLFDFVDFNLPELSRQIPSKKDKGVYIPQSIHAPFKEKWSLFYFAMSVMAKDYNFTPLTNIAHNYLKK